MGIAVLFQKPEGIRSVGDLGIYVKIILKRMLRQQHWKLWTGFMWVRIGTSGGIFSFH